MPLFLFSFSRSGRVPRLPVLIVEAAGFEPAEPEGTGFTDRLGSPSPCASLIDCFFGKQQGRRLLYPKATVLRTIPAPRTRCALMFFLGEMGISRLPVLEQQDSNLRSRAYKALALTTELYSIFSAGAGREPTILCV